jgi:hypothetical protein
MRIVNRVLDAVQRRFRRARPGSVLIMVVSLLVLLALIGTAAISTARLDRADSRQNMANVQVDILAEGVKQMVLGQLVNDLFGYQALNWTDAAGSDPDEENDDTRDAMLGSRLPERLMTYDPRVYPTSPTYNANAFVDDVLRLADGNQPYWRYVSYPPLQNGTPTAGNRQAAFKFDDPTMNSSDPVNFALQLPKPLMTPTVKDVNGQAYPAFQEFNVKGVANGPAFLAGDADGDGVADSVLFRLPVSPLGGITYYGSVRVVDGGSAINVNTARLASDDTGNVPNDETVKELLVRQGGGETPQPVSLAGMFPASVTLPTAISLAEFNRLENERNGGGTFDLQANPWADQAGVTPYVADERTDFRFLTPGDMLHHQLGRRLDNPGSFRNLDRFGYGSRPFSIGDAMALAYGFTLVNPSAYDSKVEKTLTPSVIDLYNPGGKPQFNVSAYPTTTADVATWFRRNFDYFPNGGAALTNPPQNAGADGGKQFPRPYLTAFNPVRNTVRRPASAAASATQPSARYPAKTNPNTADFDELYQAFSDTMAGPLGTSTPFDDDAATRVDDPYFGMHFLADGRQYDDVQDEQHPARMFRSPLRTSPGATNATNPLPALHPVQVRSLRAALAAANALSHRDGLPNDPPVGYPVTLQLPQNAPNPGNKFKPVYNAVVFGTKRQPFITEVFLNNNPEKQVPLQESPYLDEPDAANLQNQNGFAAIELYNPYDEPMVLTGWRIRVIDRDGSPNLVMRRLDEADLTMPPEKKESELDPATEPVISGTIPPRGYMVIWNYLKGSADPDSAQYLPAPLKPLKNPVETELVDDPGVGGVKIVHVKELHKVIGKEFVLMRPAVGAPVGPGPLLAPVDSFDSTGLTHQTFADGAPAATAESWHYVRANDQNTRAWHFVYPGRYQATQAGSAVAAVNRRRQQGTNTTITPPLTDPPPPEPPKPVEWNPAPDKAQEDPWKNGDPNAPVLMGRAKTRSANGHVTHSREGTAANDAVSSFPIQIANADFDVKVNPGAKPAFPMRGFPRVGDVLQVPYIGAYLITDPAKGLSDDEPHDWQKYVEINALPMDAAFADDTDPQDDFRVAGGVRIPIEDVGRFVPMIEPGIDLGAKKARGVLTKVGATQVDDEPPTPPLPPATREKSDFWNEYDLVVTNNGSGGTWKEQIRRVKTYTKTSTGGTFEVYTPFDPPLDPANPRYRYRLERVRYEWAGRVFDYFTTLHNPGNDFLPDRHPDDLATASAPVKNLSDTSRETNRNNYPNSAPEDDVPAEGLININTASWKVLAQLPLVMQAADPTKVDYALTERLAKRIVYYRDIDDGMGPPDDMGNPQPHPHGKFKSLAELNAIPQFVTAEDTMPFWDDQGKGRGQTELHKRGDLSTLSADADGDRVGYDFEKKYLNLTRVSNLLTTRSDAYTVYLQVQGWRDAGTVNAKLVVQRRLAFIVDRSRLTATDKTPRVYNLPVPAAQ